MLIGFIINLLISILKFLTQFACQNKTETPFYIHNKG